MSSGRVRSPDASILSFFPHYAVQARRGETEGQCGDEEKGDGWRSIQFKTESGLCNGVDGISGHAPHLTRKPCEGPRPVSAGCRAGSRRPGAARRGNAQSQAPSTS